MMNGAQGQGSSDQRGTWYHFAVWLAAVALAVTVTFAPHSIPARFKAEHWAADWRTALLSDRRSETHPRFAIVSVTPRSLEQFRYFLPIHRGHLADLVEAADEAGASAIGLDFYFTRPTEDEADGRLVSVLQRAKDKVVLGVYEGDLSDGALKYQYDLIERTGARGGYIDLVPDWDRVVRYRAYPRNGARYPISFSSMLVRKREGNSHPDPARIAWLLSPSEKEEAFLAIESQELLQMSSEKRTTFLNGRIVLIGGELFTLDRHSTPLSIRTEKDMFGVEIHAHMAAELLDGNRSYSELSRIQTRFLVGGLALLGFVLGARFQRREWDYLDWRIASLFVIGVDLVLFKLFHVILPFTLAAVGWISGVTAGTQIWKVGAFASRAVRNVRPQPTLR
jgi:adenylate cyclase